MDIIFVLAVLLFAIFWFLATWPVNYADRIAKGFLLLAVVIWAIGHVHG